jgi:antirestriction protein ArdC
MNKSEIQQQVTDLIIKELENGNAPWRKGWNAHGYLPSNIVSGKEYSGINSLILSIVGRSYSRGLWLTYKQAQQLGGSVMEGQKGVHVVYYSKVKAKDKETQEERSFALMRNYVVFNVDQCVNVKIPSKYLIEREPVSPIAATDDMLKSYVNGPTVYYKEQAGAYYSPVEDSITLPSLAQFESAQEHAYTLAHELVHSTGHESRLNRWDKAEEKPSRFGCESYAKEELVAELGACMTLSALGVEVDIPNSGAYIKNWLGALKDDKSLIFTASAKASKAMMRVLGTKVEEEVAA